MSENIDASQISKLLAHRLKGKSGAEALLAHQTKNLEAGQAFKNVLSRYVGDVNVLQHEADDQIQQVAAGKTEDLHEVMIAMDEAETSFELMMEMRNKLVDAYKELSRMQS